MDARQFSELQYELERASSEGMPTAEVFHDFAAVKSRPITRMLIVDDDPDVRRLLRTQLEARDYVVDFTSSSEDAIARLREFAPDVVFLDVAESGANGLDLLDLVRAHDLDMAVIVITADHSEELLIEALRRGADDYLSKPLNRGEFETELDRVVGRLTASRRNAARHNRLGLELARAAQIQAELLPRDVPAMSGFEISARCVPAHGVGGDFYDWQQVAHDCINVSVGDVMGKGLSAALLMTAARTVLRSVAADNDPATAVRLTALTLDDDLSRSGAFVTIFHAQLDVTTGCLSYVDAGHGYALLRRADGTFEALPPGSLPLGVMADEMYAAGTVVLNPGDVFVIYTDGLREARPDLWPTHAAVCRHIADAPNASAIVERLIEDACANGPVDDDVTVVVLRRTDALPPPNTLN